MKDTQTLPVKALTNGITLGVVLMFAYLFRSYPLEHKLIVLVLVTAVFGVAWWDQQTILARAGFYNPYTNATAKRAHDYLWRVHPYRMAWMQAARISAVLMVLVMFAEFSYRTFF